MGQRVAATGYAKIANKPCASKRALRARKTMRISSPCHPCLFGICRGKAGAEAPPQFGGDFPQKSKATAMDNSPWTMDNGKDGTENDFLIVGGVYCGLPFEETA